MWSFTQATAVWRWPHSEDCVASDGRAPLNAPTCFDLIHASPPIPPTSPRPPLKAATDPPSTDGADAGAGLKSSKTELHVEMQLGCRRQGFRPSRRRRRHPNRPGDDLRRICFQGPIGLRDRSTRVGPSPTYDQIAEPMHSRTYTRARAPGPRDDLRRLRGHVRTVALGNHCPQ